jgi:hypothetical protein
MLPRLLTFLLPPVIGLGASYAFAPLAAGMLPPERIAPAMVQASEVPSAEVWDRIGEIETAATAAALEVGAEAVSPRPAASIRDLGVFQKPVADGDEQLSRVLNLGRFNTRVERDGSRHSLSAGLAFEFTSHEAALAAYEPTALMRLRDAALNALIAAGQDEAVYRSGFSDRELLRSVEAMVRTALPEVAAVHLLDLSLRGGPLRTAMRP